MPVGSASQVPSTRPPEGYFICQEQGLQTLKGVAEPMPVYRVLEESGTQSRLDVATSRGLAPLVGREQEVGLLLDRWNQVKDGQGQTVAEALRVVDTTREGICQAELQEAKAPLDELA